MLNAVQDLAAVLRALEISESALSHHVHRAATAGLAAGSVADGVVFGPGIPRVE